jgi:amidase
MVSPACAWAIEEAPIAGIHVAYRAGTRTVHAVTAACLARIAAYDQSGPYIHARITVNVQALEEAETLDTAYRASGTCIGPLHGIPVIVKDNLDAVGMPMTAGFQGWKKDYPPTDAPVVGQIKAAGGILLANASLSACAKGGGDNINAVLPGFARNPYHTAYATGGSSGGPQHGPAASGAPSPAAHARRPPLPHRRARGTAGGGA